MAIQLNDNIEVKAPKPSEYRYFHPDNRPWLSVAEVNSIIPLTERHPGLVVFVVDTKYIYKDGILDTDLILDNDGGTQDLQSVTSQGNTTSNEVIFQSTVFVDRIRNNSNLSLLKIEDNQFVFSVNNGRQFATPTDEPIPAERTLATREWVADNVSGVTNLSYTPSPTNGTVTSNTGTNATIPLADSTNAGLFAPAEKTKLASITEIFTIGLKASYDNAVTWISTNSTSILNHISNTSNPHNVTKSQVGLSNVDNISDANKPISIAQQAAINAKQNLPIVRTGNFTPSINSINHVTTNATVTNPTGVEGFGYTIKVLAGITTLPNGFTYEKDTIIEVTFVSETWQYYVITEDDLVITTSVNISTDARWKGRKVSINNSTNNITVTINHDGTCSGTKEGLGDIDFLDGTQAITPIFGLTSITGNGGGTFAISKKLGGVSNRVNLWIINA